MPNPITTSASTSIYSDAVSQFADLQRQIAEETEKRRLQKEELDNNENLKGPSGAVTEYQKTVKKSSSTYKAFSTDIGVLVKNTSRLNVISKLAEGDSVDFFKFRVTGRGDAALGSVGDEGVRVQLMSQTGMVVADSNAEAGEAYERYQDLKGGKLELSSGMYTLRVTREKSADPKAELNYALQIRMGDYKQDFDTVAKQPAAGDGPLQTPEHIQTLQSMLNQSTSFISSLPAIGTSATDKLMGALYDGFA